LKSSYQLSFNTIFEFPRFRGFVLWRKINTPKTSHLRHLYLFNLLISSFWKFSSLYPNSQTKPKYFCWSNGWWLNQLDHSGKVYILNVASKIMALLTLCDKKYKDEIYFSNRQIPLLIYLLNPMLWFCHNGFCTGTLRSFLRTFNWALLSITKSHALILSIFNW
jgi:hypothetical protein